MIQQSLHKLQNKLLIGLEACQLFYICRRWRVAGSGSRNDKF